MWRVKPEFAVRVVAMGATLIGRQRGCRRAGLRLWRLEQAGETTQRGVRFWIGRRQWSRSRSDPAAGYRAIVRAGR